MWQEDDPQFPLYYSTQPNNEKEVCIVTRGKVFKALVLAMALVMLFSVTAFAGSVSWNADGGASATGYCGPYSSSTSVSTPMYIFTSITVSCENIYGYNLDYYDEASNAGTSISASINSSIVRYRYSSRSTHIAGSTSRDCEY